MSYASNWLNGIHENIQNRDAIESAKKKKVELEIVKCTILLS